MSQLIKETPVNRGEKNRGNGIFIFLLARFTGLCMNRGGIYAADFLPQPLCFLKFSKISPHTIYHIHPVIFLLNVPYFVKKHPSTNSSPFFSSSWDTPEYSFYSYIVHVIFSFYYIMDKGHQRTT